MITKVTKTVSPKNKDFDPPKKFKIVLYYKDIMQLFSADSSIF